MAENDALFWNNISTNTADGAFLHGGWNIIFTGYFAKLLPIFRFISLRNTNNCGDYEDMQR